MLSFFSLFQQPLFILACSPAHSLSLQFSLSPAPRRFLAALYRISYTASPSCLPAQSCVSQIPFLDAATLRFACISHHSTYFTARLFLTTCTLFGAPLPKSRTLRAPSCPALQHSLCHLLQGRKLTSSPRLALAVDSLRPCPPLCAAPTLLCVAQGPDEQLTEIVQWGHEVSSN
eukprot:4033275-Pleurochrysis_carterae.AAC.2